MSQRYKYLPAFTVRFRTVHPRIDGFRAAREATGDGTAGAGGLAA